MRRADRKESTCYPPSPRGKSTAYTDEQREQLRRGLLQVSDDIVSQFKIDDHWRTPANVNLTIFLRSDIFAFIQPTAPEQDKLPIQRIIWDDPEVLKRLIDHRLEFGSISSEAAGAIWDKLFPTEVVGIPAWVFVINTVLPRAQRYCLSNERSC